MTAYPEAQQLLSLISLLPAGVLSGQLPAIAPSFTSSRLNQATDVLRATTLAYSNKEGTLHVLSPIQKYMLAYHAPSDELVKPLEDYYCKLAKWSCSQPGDKDYKAASQNLEKVEANMEAILLHALRHHPDFHVVHACLGFSQFLCWTRPRTEIISLATKVAQDLDESDLEAKCLQHMGDILRTQDKYDEATSILTGAKVQFEATGNQMRAAQCLHSLGEILWMQDKYDEASFVRVTLRRGHSYMKILQDRGEPNRCDTLTQW